MNKKIFILGVIGMFLFLLSMSFSSAYYYRNPYQEIYGVRYSGNYNPYYYNGYSYISSRNNIQYARPIYSRTITYSDTISYLPSNYRYGSYDFRVYDGYGYNSYRMNRYRYWSYF